jgi:hypothetical protein
MSEQLWKFLFSLTIVLPALIGLVRYRKADTAYRPFLIYIFYSLFNELFVGLYLSGRSKNGEIINWEVFNLLEGLLLLIQFYYWQRFKSYRNVFFILLFATIAGWVLENFVFSSIYSFNPVFLIACSFLIILLSINTINHQVVNYNRSISKNPIFIICVALCIYFIYNIFVFTFLAKGASNYDKKFMKNVFEIKVYINALTNILYAIGVFYIPGKTMHRRLFFEEKNETK